MWSSYKYFNPKLNRRFLSISDLSESPFHTFVKKVCEWVKTHLPLSAVYMVRNVALLAVIMYYILTKMNFGKFALHIAHRDCHKLSCKLNIIKKCIVKYMKRCWICLSHIATISVINNRKYMHYFKFRNCSYSFIFTKFANFPKNKKSLKFYFTIIPQDHVPAKMKCR